MGSGRVSQMDVWVPALPQRALSANGGGRSRRDPWSLSEAKLALGDVTWHAILAAHGPNVPHLTPPVIISATLYARHGTKNGDGLYRPTDPSNLGGDCLKPIVDAFVKHQVIPDDSYKYVELVTLRVQHVDRLEDEGVSVNIRELAVEATA